MHNHYLLVVWCSRLVCIDWVVKRPSRLWRHGNARVAEHNLLIDAISPLGDGHNVEVRILVFLVRQWHITIYLRPLGGGLLPFVLLLFLRVLLSRRHVVA